MPKDRSAARLLLAAAVLLLTVFSVFLSAGVPPENAVPEKTATPGDAASGGNKTADTAAPYDISETPEDILRMQTLFREEHGADENTVSVREEFCVTDGATDIIGNVAVKNTTALRPDLRALLDSGADPGLTDRTGPAVLVFHTHTSESYMMTDDGLYYPSLPTHLTEADRNMLRIGEELCNTLTSRGIGCLHDTGVYDGEYTGAYSRSREAVLRYLEEYPSLKIVLDVHRDAVTEDGIRIKPTAVVNGKKAAQIMILTGAEAGDITDFPDWEENLRFALCLQKAAQEKYTGLMKPVFFCPRKYNMDTAKCSVLLEIGTESNTLEEAVYSARLIADVLADMIEETERS